MERTSRVFLLTGVACLVIGCAARSPKESSETRESEAPPDAKAFKMVEPKSAPPRSPGVKAGWADDNQQYNYYLHYLKRFESINALKVDVSNRLMLTVLDSKGHSIPNCALRFTSPKGTLLCERKTYADGRAMFFPFESGEFEVEQVKVEARHGQHVVTQEMNIKGRKGIELRFPTERPTFQSVPLDIAFVIDTTGSMGDEIERLRRTLEAIRYQVTQMTPKPDVRFAMVLYRDRGDEYVTKVTPFTSDFSEFTKALQAVAAGGGGDNPEDVQEGLRGAMQDLKWRPDGIRMAFLLADAPPHLDYADQKFTYVDAMRAAAKDAIKVTTIGASGLDEQGEYVFRQISQYTMGLFVFLTYGEKGESGGTPWTVSHHTGENWQAQDLDAIIVQSIRRELSHLSPTPPQLPEDYFAAQPAPGVQNDAVLDELFTECVRQLVDYSQEKLEPGTPTAVLPVTAAEKCQTVKDALDDHLSMTMSRNKTFQLIERENLKQVMMELDLGATTAFDAKLSPKPGKQIVAKLLVLSKVSRAGANYQVFVKMVRVETGEVLSASMMKIDERLLK